MKLKTGFALTEIADEYVAVPIDCDGGIFRGIVRLNETGADIWRGIAEGLDETQIADRLVEQYNGIDNKRAMDAVKAVADKLRTEGLLEE